MKQIATFISIMFLLVCVTGGFAQEDLNYFTNWEFDQGTEGWMFWDGSPDADALYQIDENGMLSGDSSLFWEIIQGGPNSWYVQTYQMVPCYEYVEYYLDFLIAYEGPDTLNVFWVWELAEDPYTKYATKDTFVTEPITRMQSMVIPQATDETANLKIFLGLNENALVWLDRIYISEVPLEIEDKVELKSNGIVPTEFSLGENFPNPFNPRTTITYDVGQRARISIDIFNLAGQYITTLVDAEFAPGQYQVGWNSLDALGREVPSGIYLYRMNADDFVMTKKMILMQ